ncbi:hypothetical protein WS90_35300 [Burkholderia cepacia]|uniref:Uncharacterized protein n=1 Tax=Burkholderia cepacia TaxID=292 RepID=A0A103Z2K8_BURCE|nr:hypothetical protein WS90_35300 [Burkholderia cepacia]
MTRHLSRLDDGLRISDGVFISQLFGNSDQAHLLLKRINGNVGQEPVTPFAIVLFDKLVRFAICIRASVGRINDATA